MLISCGKRRQPPPLLDELEDGDGLVAGVVDIAFLGKRGDDDGRHAGPGAKLVDDRGSDVVPSAAVFVVDDDDGAVFPDVVFLDALNEVGAPLLAGIEGVFAGMLAIGVCAADEADGGDGSFVEGLIELVEVE